MKAMRFVSFLFGVFFSVAVFAMGKDSLHAVTMVLYEQDKFDAEGTLALKNNTDEGIYNLIYRIIYMDMSGNPVDYANYSSEVNIPSGLTKKVDIPAYEHERQYSYYKSDSYNDESHQFQVRFELIGYNYSEEDFEEAEEQYEVSSSNGHWLGGVIAFFMVLFALGLFVGMYVLVAVMARQRRRSAAVWVLLSLIATPLLMAFILLCIGKSSSGRAEEFD